MNTRLEALTAILSAEVALDQWDASPSIGLMVEDENEFRLIAVDFSQHFWTLSDPATLLAIISVALEHPDRAEWGAFPAQLPEGFHLVGITLFTEGWGLDLTGIPPKARAKAMRLSEERGLSTHPNRIEVKMICALDTDGGRYSTTYKRGAPGPAEMTEDKSGAKLSGRVFDGLDAILRALKESDL